MSAFLLCGNGVGSGNRVGLGGGIKWGGGGVVVERGAAGPDLSG